MAAAVAKDYDRKGLAIHVLEALIDRAERAGLARIVAPIRPTWKHKYPFVSMAEYAAWTRADGLSIDPWIRTHQRMGATVIKPAPNSVVVPGTVGGLGGHAVSRVRKLRRARRPQPRRS
jgi:GNAT superfamily N-acetyltransferase